MKVALYNPESPFLIDQKVMPPLGLLYLSAVLKRAGHEVEVLDWADGQRVADADLHGVTSTTAQFYNAVVILKKIKEKQPDARVVIGGPHATMDEESCFKEGFDCVAQGEGESAILDVIGLPKSKLIKGVAVKNLDFLPMPDREALDLHSYRYKIDGEPATTMMTSRGCYYGKCSYCESRKIWGGIRFNSASRVIAEVKTISNVYGFKAIMFYDDELLFNWRRDQKIAVALKEEEIKWRCFTRSDLLTEEKVRTIADCGCKEVLLGVESGSDRLLKNVNKGTTAALNKKAISLLKKYNIRCKAAIIIGLPGESWETIRETTKFLETSQPDDVDFSIMTVFPGTDIYSHPSKYDLEWGALDYEKMYHKGKPGEYHGTVRTSHMSTEEILGARKMLERKFKPELWG